MRSNRIHLSALLAALVLSIGVASPPAVATGSGPAAEVIGLYGAMHHAMARDTAAGVREAAKKIQDLAAEEAGRAADPAPWRVLASAAETVSGDDLEALREQFKGFSKAMALFVNSTGADGVQIWHCGMADAYWLQPSEEGGAENPYYGSSMLKCGSKVDEVES